MTLESYDFSRGSMSKSAVIAKNQKLSFIVTIAILLYLRKILFLLIISMDIMIIFVSIASKNLMKFMTNKEI